MAMQIRIEVQGTILTATLEDNITSRDFMSLLPLSLKLEDYAATEKIGYLPRKLATDGRSTSAKPTIGDVTYYAPWSNLAIFHKPFQYSNELIKLGRLDSGLDVLARIGLIPVTIARMDRPKP